MARVLYTGGLVPALFARAKKEAEKAERIPGYKPRAIKTPTHTVIYNTSGPEVKAIITDDIAPITFSTPGSAIPISPNFLHLNENRPLIKYGKFRYAEHETTYSVPQVDYRSIWWRKKYPFQFERGFEGIPRDNFAVAQSLVFSGYQDIFYALKYIDSSIQYNQIGFDQKISAANTGVNFFVEAAADVSVYDQYLDQFYRGAGYSIQSTMSGTFLVDDIRSLYKTGFNVANKSIEAVSLTTLNNDHSQGWLSYVTTYNSNSMLYDGSTSVCAFDGSVVFPFVGLLDESFNSLDWPDDGTPWITVDANHSGNYAISRGVCFNLDGNKKKLFEEKTIHTQYNFNGPIGFAESGVGWYYGEYKDNVQHLSLDYGESSAFIYVLSSCGIFDGVLIKCKVFANWPSDGKIIYDENSSFIASGLGVYFDMVRGAYDLVEFENTHADKHPPHLKPPRLVPDGICLPHAWWFAGGKGIRENTFYANNQGQINVVIYPGGQHEFFVEEAKIVSVRMNHVPRFAIQPGDEIGLTMKAMFGGSPYVPYAITGLIEEEDEDGNATGFYITGEGSLSGSFSAAHPAPGNSYLSLKISPRQPTDRYRLVTVLTQTARANPVTAHFEFYGEGENNVTPGMSLSVECLTQSVLAGQYSHFYITASAVANGSQIPYRVKRNGEVVVGETGFASVIDGAAMLQYMAKFYVERSVFTSDVFGHTDIKYVLSATSGDAEQETIEFTMEIGDGDDVVSAPFSVQYAQERYDSDTYRPTASEVESPTFFLQASVKHPGPSESFFACNELTTLVERVWYSLKKKRVYVLFWDGQSCDVTGVIRKNEVTGQYEANPDWREAPFDYPPAADPYNTKGTLEPYVYAYMDYVANQPSTI